MRHGLTDDEINQITAFDPWFLARIREIIDTEAQVRKRRPADQPKRLRKLKMMGFTDARLAKLTGRDEAQVRRARRNRLGVTAVFKRIDTCAAEFEAQTPYMYSTYEHPAMGDVECESRPSKAKKVVILGGGPNRIGQGIEFDYCCVHACYALTAAGYETIMVNCNPETVSPTTTPPTASISNPSPWNTSSKSCGSSRKTAPSTASSSSSAARPR